MADPGTCHKSASALLLEFSRQATQTSGDREPGAKIGRFCCGACGDTRKDRQALLPLARERHNWSPAARPSPASVAWASPANRPALFGAVTGFPVIARANGHGDNPFHEAPSAPVRGGSSKDRSRLHAPALMQRFGPTVTLAAVTPTTDGVFCWPLPSAQPPLPSEASITQQRWWVELRPAGRGASQLVRADVVCGATSGCLSRL
jgi:hypothetical protein